jgi:galactokinase
MNKSAMAQKFFTLYQSTPNFFYAPGRVNLIGEHTDYNEGFVLPCAIGFQAWIATSPRNDSKLLMHSENFPDSFEFDVRNMPQKRIDAWCDYLLGVASVLGRADISIPGANLLVEGDVPIGSGLSSSAAVEVASALAFLGLSGESLPWPELARICQEAENNFVGARVGIMDQFVSCLARAGHALLLDCRSLEYQMIPVPDNIRIVICNTLVKHKIAGGEYNTRREECDEAVKILGQWYKGIHALRDINLKQLQAHRADMPRNIYHRALHVVSENRRVKDAVDALMRNNINEVGQLMKESHRSLRDLYEVSCRELDIMVEGAEGLPGYRGGRMTGGGFGGCTVNLVDASHADIFAEQIAVRYKEKTGIQPDIYVSFPANGAGADLAETATAVQ